MLSTFQIPCKDALTSLITSKSELHYLIPATITDVPNAFHMEYEIGEREVSLEDLLADKQFNSDLLMALIASWLELEKELDAFLLDVGQIKLHPNSIYYLPDKGTYRFVYIPLNYTKENNMTFLYDNDICQLISDLVIQLYLDKAIHHKQVLNVFHYLEKGKILELKFIFPPKAKKPKQSVKAKKQVKPVESTPYLFEKLNPNKQFPLCYQHNTLGSGRENAIQVEDHSVLLKHAVITKMEHYYMIRRLSERGEVRLNGENVRDESHLKSGDSLCIGNKEFIFISP